MQKGQKSETVSCVVAASELPVLETYMPGKVQMLFRYRKATRQVAAGSASYSLSSAKLSGFGWTATRCSVKRLVRAVMQYEML